MGTLHVLTLLLSALLLCSAASHLGPVTCSEGNSSVTADVAVHHINEHHEHGYKFRLHEVQGNKVEQFDGGCNVELQLELRETTCHTINPKPFEDCELREMHARAVMANCSVLMTVKDGEANITKYQCDTKQVQTIHRCPDCPILIALNSSVGLKSIHEAVTEFNKNTSNQHYYILKEVGRILAGYVMSSGMFYYGEFALVETHCPMGSRIVPEACVPFCPDRARHAFCRSTYSAANGLQSIKCDFYPSLNSTALGPGEEEPFCSHRRRHHSHGHSHGPPSHPGKRDPPPRAPGHDHGPPTHAGSGGPPPHAHGPPTHPGSRDPPPRAPSHDHSPPTHAGSGGPPPHAHGPPTHPGSRDPPPRDHGHGHRPSTHPGSAGRPPHGRDHFHDHHFHSCRRVLSNPDPALHPICPWPLPRPKNTES